MSKSIPQNALVVVADGHSAILFRNQGSSGEVSLREERRLTPKNLRDEGPSGSRPTEQTPRQTDEATFAKQLADALFKMKHNGDFRDLVLVVDPQTLGQFRDTMHKELEECIVLTLAKELTNHSANDIADALNAAS